MSNRRRLTPPPGVAAYARAYRCHDCDADVGPPRKGTDGLWHIDIHHDETCPTLTGHVDRTGAGLSAALAAAKTGAPVLYIGGTP